MGPRPGGGSPELDFVDHLHAMAVLPSPRTRRHHRQPATLGDDFMTYLAATLDHYTD